MFKTANMKYRNLGKSGLKVSAISLGIFVNSESTVDDLVNVLKVSLVNGVNHFDTAEIYSAGQNETMLGEALKKIGEDREKYVISTKIWRDPNPCINSMNNTNKKHIKESVRGSLKRLQLDYVDIIYAHSWDETTPMEEICRAFHEVIEDGEAFYWGTSNWDADVVVKAMQICEKYNLHKPVAGQNYYNMGHREQAESEYRRLFEVFGYGLVAYAPLMGGFLTGKYIDQNKTEGRYNQETVNGIQTKAFKDMYLESYNTEKLNASLKELKPIAENELNCTLAQLAVAWVMKYQHTSTALIGAKNPAQMQDSFKALEVVDKLTVEMEGKINKILGTHPSARMDFKTFAPTAHIRPLAQ